MCLGGSVAADTLCSSISLSENTNTSAVLRCHIYDNQSIIHLLGLPLPCVDPTAMLPAHIWLHGAALSPGWDLPLVMGHLGGQMKLRLDECFVYYGYGALWRHWQLHIDSLLSRRPTSAVVLSVLSHTENKRRALEFCYILRFKAKSLFERKIRKDNVDQVPYLLDQCKCQMDKITY